MTRIVFATFGGGGCSTTKNRDRFFARCRQLKVQSILATRAHPKEIDVCIAYGLSYPKQVDFWLDSGAFTAWTRGCVYKADEYYEFIVNLLPQLKVFKRVFAISLDKIPGRINERVTQDDLKIAIDTTIKNTQWLTAKGLNVVPIHHQGEPLWVMEEYLKMAEYVGISPANDSPQKKRINYIQSLWKLFKSDTSIHPSHNFGNVSAEQLKTFPFYSADSSTFGATEKYGRKVDISISGKCDQSTTAVSSYQGRHQAVEVSTANIQKFQKFESDLQKLWKLRGITWREPRGLDLSSR